VKHIYLHIGTHKTGSTSIQTFLQKESKLLNEKGFDFYQGFHNKKNHIELFLSTMREGRDSFAKEKFDIENAENYFCKTKNFVHQCINQSKYDKIIFSTEGLSLLRFTDELTKLKELLKSEENKITIILYLRKESDFLDSYKKQIKKRTRSFSDNPSSVYYVKDDTWLTDYSTLKKSYSDAFDEENLVIIDYDKETITNNNVLPSFLLALGIQDYPDHVIGKYFKNVTNDPKKASNKEKSYLMGFINKVRSVLKN